MLSWAKNAVGITEPIYGPSAIQSVAEQAKETPYTDLTKDDLAWECMDSTCVETKTFYMLSNDGHVGMAQVIYSNVLGIRTTAQFSSKIFAKDAGEEHLWSTDNIPSFSFSPDKHDFHADDCSMEITEDGQSYVIKSSLNPNSIVDLKFTQAAPGFKVGKDGTSNFGTDPENPWGREKHLFWPRCSVEGNIVTPQGTVDFTGRGVFIHAQQGMKPHFAACRWNFATFHSATYSAVMMEFTTPPSYGDTVVNVGGIATDGAILIANASPATKAEHTHVVDDPDNDWPAPSAAAYTWAGKASDGKEVTAKVEGDLGPRCDRVDVMGELPRFVKQIVAGASGAKPYIYQYSTPMRLKLNIGGEEKEEEGHLFAEATFIS